MRLLWIILCFLLFSCANRPRERIVIRGSDTEVNLVLQMAEIFMDRDPEVSIAVTGGGSGTGLAALINRKTDIANSSRDFSSYELRLAKEREIEVLDFIFARDALCFIVNKELELDSLSIEKISAIYKGQLKNWEEAGAQNLPISLYGRQSNSGTFIYIRDSILRGDYSLGMKQMNGNAQIIEGVRNDPAGIGYVGIGYVVKEDGEVLEGLKILSLKISRNVAAISPNESENILNGSYPVIRPLFQFLDGKPDGKLKDFLLFEISEEGQKMIKYGGYFPIDDRQMKHNLKLLHNE
ncbi:MAG: phosphate ABC transporter substrate-binding protein [Bacteroidota bacterium]